MTESKKAEDNPGVIDDRVANIPPYVSTPAELRKAAITNKGAWSGMFRRAASAGGVFKGEGEGHPFRGNQYSSEGASGASAGASQGASTTPAASVTPAAVDNPHGTPGPVYASPQERARAKADFSARGSPKQQVKAWVDAGLLPPVYARYASAMTPVDGQVVPTKQQEKDAVAGGLGKGPESKPTEQDARWAIAQQKEDYSQGRGGSQEDQIKADSARRAIVAANTITDPNEAWRLAQATEDRNRHEQAAAFYNRAYLLWGAKNKKD